MKFLLFSSIVISFAVVYTTANTIGSNLNDEQKALLAEHRKICKEKVPDVDDQLINKAKEGELSDDPTLKEYIACIIVKIGLISEDNTIHKDVLKAKAELALGDQSLADKTTDECVKEKKDDYVETAYALVRCFAEKTHFTAI